MALNCQIFDYNDYLSQLKNFSRLTEAGEFIWGYMTFNKYFAPLDILNGKSVALLKMEADEMLS